MIIFYYPNDSSDAVFTTPEIDGFADGARRRPSCFFYEGFIYNNGIYAIGGICIRKIPAGNKRDFKYRQKRIVNPALFNGYRLPVDFYFGRAPAAVLCGNAQDIALGR